MKNFKTFLYEMAKPLSHHSNMMFYHGTGEKEASEIIKSGHIKGRDTQGKASLAPIKGHA